MKTKIIRACTVPQSLGFVKGMLPDLCKQYEVVLLSSPGEQMGQITKEYGVKGIGIPMERHISLFKDIRALVKIIMVFRKEKPTMVHSMTPKAGMLCMIAAWVAHVPVRVHTFTGLIFPTSIGIKRKVLMATDYLTCACATHVIPEGEGVKNDLQNNGITKKPLKVLGYGNVRGIDLNRFSYRPDVVLLANSIKKESVFTFVFVGRIVKDKGINELCKAFDKLSCISLMRLILIGRYEDSLDPISNETREIIARNDSIEVVGPQYGDDLIAYYAAADCFVMPSYREGFPNTVLEAGAMGLPSIVTDINGSREIVKDGVNGLIVPPRNVDRLYDAMREMVQASDDRQRMAGNARKMIADRFEQGYVRRCLYDFYDEILKPYV
jgi:glycosyltransferase involved in cell wall biosynthesis